MPDRMEGITRAVGFGFTRILAFFWEFFSGGEFIVMEFFVMLIFLLFSDQISEGKSL